MPAPEEIRKLTQGVVASFDSGIDAVGHLIEKGLELLDGYRQEEEAVRGTLRDSLASIGSLRRKDFDRATAGILEFQSRREGELKALIRGFLAREKQLAGRLKRSLEAGILEEVRRIQAELQGMIERARNEIIAFQGEQQKIRSAFAQLEAQDKKVSVREFKQAIQELEAKLLGPPLPEAESAQAVGET